MTGVKFWLSAGLSSLALAAPVGSAWSFQRTAPAAATLSYADHADLALSAPLVAHVRIRRADRLTGDAAAAVPVGKTRFYVGAEVVSLIKGADGLPGQVSYLVDLPAEAGGGRPRLRRKGEYLLFASAVPGRLGELRLAAPDAQIAWNAAGAAQVRAILTEASRSDAAPRIIGAGKAFNVPGTLPGESESQIFLQTETDQPVSLSILRRPGQTPRWAVALGEIVDDSAEPPRPGTLLWYRLACGLPRTLPAESLAEAGAGGTAAIRGDYRLVLDGLGPCVRTRTRR